VKIIYKIFLHTALVFTLIACGESTGINAGSENISSDATKDSPDINTSQSNTSSSDDTSAITIINSPDINTSDINVSSDDNTLDNNVSSDDNTSDNNVSNNLDSNNSVFVTPQGFGANTTGGEGGEIVRVRTMEELETALCNVTSGGICTDNEARIIEVEGTIDFRGSAGTTSREGCNYGKVCSSPFVTETLVLLNDSDTHCNGKTTFNITYDKAADEKLLIGSNKTVVGIGSNATIKGKELRLYKVSNVIIQNLTISDINEGIIFVGDGIELAEVDNIWIDHNKFERIGRHFITGHYGYVKNTTISWNDFNGYSLASNNCDAIHYWNVFLIADEQSITFANNWLREFSGRAPKVGGNTIMQVVNNYFDHGTWHALDVHSEVDSISKVLVEGNYFNDVDTPITEESSSVFAVNGEPDSATQTLCNTALGRDCVGNTLTQSPSVDKFVQDSDVTDAFHLISTQKIITPLNANKIPTLINSGAGPGHI
jgi:pectate lyase